MNHALTQAEAAGSGIWAPYCRLISRVRGPVGRRPTPKEVRELIFRIVAELPSWVHLKGFRPISVQLRAE